MLKSVIFKYVHKQLKPGHFSSFSLGLQSEDTAELAFVNFEYHDLFAFVQIWICEFCGTSNEVEVVADELPTKQMVIYLITPAPATATQTLEGNSHGVTDSVVVFCIDTSGSMGITTEVYDVLRILYCDLQVLVAILTSTSISDCWQG